jgi:hypothetical protein
MEQAACVTAATVARGKAASRGRAAAAASLSLSSSRSALRGPSGGRRSAWSEPHPRVGDQDCVDRDLSGARSPVGRDGAAMNCLQDLVAADPGDRGQEGGVSRARPVAEKLAASRIGRVRIRRRSRRSRRRSRPPATAAQISHRARVDGAGPARGTRWLPRASQSPSGKSSRRRRARTRGCRRAARRRSPRRQRLPATSRRRAGR